MIYRKMLVPFKQVLNAVISCHLSDIIIVPGRISCRTSGTRVAASLCLTAKTKHLINLNDFAWFA